MNQQDQEKDITVIDAPAQPKPGLVQSAKEFFGNAFGQSKNQDLSAMVEEYTNEMTLVAEGLSQDLDKLSQRSDALDARQVEVEEKIYLRMDEIDREHKELIKQGEEILARVDALEKAAKKEKEQKAKVSERLTGVLRQATWLAGILAGAWVIVTIINLFNK